MSTKLTAKKIVQIRYDNAWVFFPGMGIWLIFFFLFNLNLYAKDITVNPFGKISSIRKAIKMAHSGDRIIIKRGEYREANITINKSLQIVGESWPEIDGENKQKILIVKANKVNISGLVIKNAGISFIEDNAGLLLDSVKNCQVINNRFINNFFAIYISQSKDCLIKNNIIEGNATRESFSGNGIHLWYSKNITIDNNQVRGHRDGIYFEFVRNGRITNNISEENLRYGLHFMFSDSCNYTENIFRKNGAGVAVMYTRHIKMSANTFENNWGSASFGLLLKEITDSHIYKNRFYKNSIGLYSEASGRNLIEKNDFRQNGWAVKIMANSMENLFLENNFEVNTFDVATNSRQNFNNFEKNYWSNYNGYDINKDGFGDVAYRPVSLFSYLVEKNPPGLILLKSFFVQLLDIAEKIIPALTPETLLDRHPRMKRY